MPAIFSRFLLPALVFFWIPAFGYSAQLTWTNEETGSWFDQGNWSPVQLPVSGDEVLIDEGTAVIDGSGAEAATVNLASPGTLAFDSINAISFSAEIAGDGSIVQRGAGTTTLTGVSIFTGTTTVEAGALFIDEGGILTGNTIVKSGATFGGDGGVGSITLESGSALIPIDCFDADSLTWNAGATLIFGLGEGPADNILELAGALQKSGAGPFAFTFENSGWEIGQTYSLILFESTNFLSSDFSFTNGGGFGGTFAFNDDDNWLLFTITSVPEPSAGMLFGAGLGILWLARRRQASRARGSIR